MKRSPLIIAIIVLLLLITGCGRSGISAPDSITLYNAAESRITTLSYSDYITGCVLAVTSPDSSEQALCAIACVLNTDTLYRLSDPRRSLFSGADLSSDSELCPEYISAQPVTDKLTAEQREKLYRAVEWGTDRAITLDGQLVDPPYCRISTGRTDSAAGFAPTAVPADEQLPDGISTAAATANSVSRTMKQLTGVSKLPADPEKWFTDPVYEPSGTLREIYFGGVRVTGEQLCKAFNLRSAAATVEYTEQRFVFTVCGWGSNSGMSINAACSMAATGATAEEILGYFYSGAELTPVNTRNTA